MSAFPTLAGNSQSALPAPPPGYQPGILAPVKRDYEDSTLYKIGSVLASFGESVPVNLKIRMAQQQADLELSKDKLAWDNYYKNNELARELSQKQNREASEQFVSLLPKMKAELSSMYGAPAEDQEKYLGHLARIADSLQPGGGDLLRFFHKNQSTVLAGDAILSHPDESISGKARESVARMGYANWLQTKEHEQLANQANNDWVTTATYTLPKPIQDKLVAQSMPESDYRQALKIAGMQKGMRPVEIGSMMAHLDTPLGQAQMTGLGVDVDAIKVAQQKKHRELSAIDRGKNEDYQKQQDILADAALPENKNKYTESYLSAVRDKVAQYNGTMARETNPGQNPNTPFNRALDIETNGRVKSMDDIALLPKTEQEKFYAVAKKVQADTRSASADAQAAAQMNKPHDLMKDPVYTLKDGKVVLTDTPMSEGAYRQRPKGMFTMTPEQKTRMGDLEYAEQAGLDLFDKADKAYKKVPPNQRVAAEAILGSDSKIVDLLLTNRVKKAYPDMADYVAQRTSASGRYAKALGGQVGVLTDQDVIRVERMFAVASDTDFVRKLKRKSYERLLALNKKALTAALAGNEGTLNAGQVTPEQLRALKDQYKNEVNGILGSVEGEVAKAGKTGSSANPALEKSTQEAVDKRERGESLLEKMRKGK
jgi:hypothetical protein